MKDLKCYQEAIAFAPIALSFVIETRDELIELWARMNVNQNALVDAGAYETYPLPRNADDISERIWAELDQYVKSQ